MNRSLSVSTGFVCCFLFPNNNISDTDLTLICAECIVIYIVQEPSFKRGLENGFVQHPLHSWLVTPGWERDVAQR